MLPEQIYDKLHESPFRPFRVRLADGSTIDVLAPNSVLVGPISAVMPLKYAQRERGLKLVLRWKTVALEQMLELMDIKPRNGGSKGHRK